MMKDQEKTALLTRVRGALEGPCGLCRGSRVLVALSGGADSVALLCLLLELAPQMDLEIYAAHLEHGIRGASSLGDAGFVTSLCAVRCVPLVLENADVPALARVRGLGLEEAARYARLAFLQRACQKTGAQAVALAHHAADQAETLLLHLVRGAGMSGLAGMQARRGCFIRPLLGEEQPMLRAYLRHIGQSWREDDTNRVPNQARNHIRAKALPVLSQINPRVTDAFCRVAEAASADDQYIWSQLDALALPCVYPMPYGGSLPRGGLEQVPTPLLRRHLQRVFWALDLPPPEARHLLALEDIARQGRGSVPLNGGVAVRASQGFLHVMRPRAQAPVEWEMQLPAGGESKLWLGMRLFVREALPDETGDGGVRQVLRQEALTDAVIRTRRAGDQYAPAGMRGTQPFKQTLIDRKIDREFRSYLPVIARGDVILWAEGLPPAREAWLRGGEKGVFFALRGHAPWRLNK